MSKFVLEINSQLKNELENLKKNNNSYVQES